MDLPILTVDTDGMELYDKGEEKSLEGTVFGICR